MASRKQLVSTQLSTSSDHPRGIGVSHSFNDSSRTQSQRVPAPSKGRPSRKRSNSHDLCTRRAFEIHTYESLLQTLVSYEASHLARLSGEIERLLAEHYQAATLVPLAAQSQLRQHKHELDTVQHRLEEYSTSLQTLSEDDSDMTLMYLSLLRRRPELFGGGRRDEILRKHHEIEVTRTSHPLSLPRLLSPLTLPSQRIVEHFLNAFSSLRTQNRMLKTRIQNAEELVSKAVHSVRSGEPYP